MINERLAIRTSHWNLWLSLFFVAYASEQISLLRELRFNRRGQMEHLATASFSGVLFE